MYYIKLTIILIILIFSLQVQAQINNNTTYLKLREEKLHISFTPFNTVEVLDNRIDTTKIFTEENGGYPPQNLTFEKSSATAIKNYIEKAISSIPKGDKTLLINIEQLRVSNKRSILRKSTKFDRSIKNNFRDYIMFSAEAYYKTNNNCYRKIVTINKIYSAYYLTTSAVSVILNNIIEAASLVDGISINAIKDTPNELEYIITHPSSFQYAKDTNSLTLEQININKRNKWIQYPIIKNHKLSNGMYLNFDDFRNDIKTPGDFQLVFNNKDSIYTFSITKDNNAVKHYLPWAVSDSGHLYINLFKNIYLKLYSQNNTFYFYVPHSLPDMYALLSIEENNMYAIIQGIMDKRIIREGLKNNFRNCFIDMDCGDIIYSSQSL